MKRITNVKRPKRAMRVYDSELRAEQTDATRRKILDALVRTMGRGVAALSIPAVAREAGVSIPTVYRHFRSKAALVAALSPHLIGRTGLMDPTVIDGADLPTIVHEMYRRNADMDAELRAALASELGQQTRRRLMPQRVALARKTIAARVPGLTGDELDRFTRVFLILTSSATLRAYKDYLGMDAARAADDVAWVAGVLQRARRNRG